VFFSVTLDTVLYSQVRGVVLQPASIKLLAANRSGRFVFIATFERQILGTALAQQVIIQIWISTHFGVLSEQLPVADEKLPFIKATFTPAPVPL
jgi:hypothetical protein